MSDKAFTDAQKQYLSGLMMGADVARTVRGLPVLAGENAASTSITVGPAEVGHHKDPAHAGLEAQTEQIGAGGKLCNEEKAKREKNPLDMWEEIASRSKQGEFPKGTDVFLTKFHGLFYVAPAQNSFMCRLRIPGGQLWAHQLSGLADLADQSAGGYIDLTTRANLQLREIDAGSAMDILYGVRELGLVSLGSGGDNIRNVTASPLSGIDENELIETIPIAKQMHHYILNHREMYGLPRKFNIAFDGGGTVSSLDDTNDIGFHAIEITDGTDETPGGVYFSLTLGGITGHCDFARDTGIIVTAAEALEVAGAIVRVFVGSGDRTNRKKARLKYVLDDWGFDKFIGAVEAQLGRTLRRSDPATWRRNQVEDRWAHVDFHAQKQAGMSYVGVVFPVGRMTSDQARGLSKVASRYGSGEIRLTVWQNLLIPNIAIDDQEAVAAEIRSLGLETQANSFRAGLVACTGSAGCKFAAANTKSDATRIAEYLEQNYDLDRPINIHLTGCHHSCAQHYIGDIGLIGTKVEVGDDMVDGYDIFLGGGWGERQGIGRQAAEKVTAEAVPQAVGEIIGKYIEQREAGEEFASFASRIADDQLSSLVESVAPVA
ncbi:MAG: NirA family protein [Aureliella sp.]